MARYPYVAWFVKSLLKPMHHLCRPILLLVLVAAAYANSLHVPFLFDDGPAIRENPTIVAPWRLQEILWGAQAEGVTTAGRPLLNLTFALNRAVGGDSVLGYHIFNVVLHAFNGLLLFGLIRRTAAICGREGKLSVEIAFFATAVWLLHPLQTAAVTYLAQRAESLAALWYLLALYGLLRGARSSSSGMWLGGSAAACYLGMLSKETMATVPLVLFLFDRTFLASSFQEAWRRRKGYYSLVFGSWILLAAVVWGLDGRGSTAGVGSTISSIAYLRTQAYAIVHYLILAVWPFELTFDYGYGVLPWSEVWPQALLMAALVVMTAVSVVRKPRLGFLLATFLLLLAPSSSWVPVASQTMAEHRMYLALVVPILIAVVAWLPGGGTWARVALGALALICGGLTIQRNALYSDPRALWAETVERAPDNPRAYANLGLVEMELGEIAEAERLFREAWRLDGNVADNAYHLALVSAQQQRYEEAEVLYREALRLDSRHAQAHNNLGSLLANAGRFDQALTHYRAAIAARPAFPEAQANLSDMLLEGGDLAGATDAAREALRLRPAFADGHFRLANALAAAGAAGEALRHYAEAVRLDAAHAPALNNWGNALLELGRVDEALVRYQQAILVDPQFYAPRRALAEIHARLGNRAPARLHAQELFLRFPDDPAAQRLWRDASAGR